MEQYTNSKDRKEEDDPSKRAFDREKDIVGSSRKIGVQQKKQMCELCWILLTCSDSICTERLTNVVTVLKLVEVAIYEFISQSDEEVTSALHQTLLDEVLIFSIPH